MNGQIDLITLVALVVAVVVIFKLRSVLGKRTGDEEARVERQRAEQRERERQRAERGGPAQDKVVSLPRREGQQAPAGAAARVPVAEIEERIRTFAGSDSAVARGLMDIARLDPAFDPGTFVNGAKAAYEMIVTAFAEGNRKMLKDLLSREVFEGFQAAIADRESRGEKIDQSFVGINKADVLEAEIKDGHAQVTVKFVSQLITATVDRAGGVIDGDPQRIKEVTDVWTFSRDISTPRARQNPNWRLVATQDAS